jgi:thymidylate synthase (FAD)
MKIADISVEYKDHMGNDKAVVDAARVSFDQDESWIDILGDRDINLIKYLAGHDHWTPFAHTAIKLKCKAPLFLARQLVKHQVGGVCNEVSRRYIATEPEFWFPEEFRAAPTDGAKQGSSDESFTNSDMATKRAKRITRQCLEEYEFLLELGTAPEQARMVLPLNTMTDWYWTGSLLFWARVCKLRLDPHAQKEAQEFANLVQYHCQKLFPVSWGYLIS